jgi:excisionase family DNA binding protein
MKEQGLSTGRAAELCSVTPDTVLKWIKRGRLPATRTAGGHYRIGERDLAALIPARNTAEASPTEACDVGGRPLRCWEYLSPAGVVKAECKKCVVYQMRAAWCFQVTSLGCEIGQRKGLCHSHCRECAYYRRVTGQATNVLIITADTQFAEVLGRGNHENVALRFARSAYEASAAIWQFQPAFAVVDQETLAHETGLLDSLRSDPRVPGLRIILAVKRLDADAGSLRGTGIAGLIEKPFGRERIVEVVKRFPVEAMPDTDRKLP